MLQADDRVLLAVSGGVDSMVLVSLVHRANISFGVAHVNYHLRGEESNMDQQLVEDWCSERNIQFHLREVNEEEYNTGVSIQMVARAIRYEFFSRIIAEYGYSKIATAHNANDNLETVLLNLTKGTGIFGLTGIAPVLDSQIIRPLLFATKEEIYAFARENHVDWREDASNAKNDYQRNRLRNVVIPELKQINPNLEETFADTLDRIKGVADIALDALSQYLIHQEETFDELKVSWVKDDLKSLVILSEVLKPFQVTYKMSKDIHEAIMNQSIGAVFSTSSHRINLDRSRLVITLKDSAENEKWFLIDYQGAHNMANGELVWKKLSGNTLPRQFKTNEAYFDFDRISWPLLVRSWEQGDAFQPFGMKGKKKVSDFMIDSKIPVTLKQQVLILESGENIVWLIGHRTDDRFKVTSETKSMLKIEYIPNA